MEGVIQAYAFIKAGMAKKCLVIGAETLSRVVDLHRDFMIYSDGAGATIVETSDDEGGILAHKTATFTYDEAYYLFLVILSTKTMTQMYAISKCTEKNL